jgi:hypothetical protein
MEITVVYQSVIKGTSAKKGRIPEHGRNRIRPRHTTPVHQIRRTDSHVILLSNRYLSFPQQISLLPEGLPPTQKPAAHTDSGLEENRQRPQPPAAEIYRPL